MGHYAYRSFWACRGYGKSVLGLGAVFFAVAALWAMADWFAVANYRPSLENTAKPAVMAVLAAAVFFVGDGSLRWFVVIALVLSLLGDVLLLEKNNHFLGGLAAFLVAHVLYAIAFLGAIRESFSPGLRLLGVAVASGLFFFAGLRIIGGALDRDRRLGGAVAVYVGVLSIMVIAAWATGSVIALAGATIFAASDAALGWNRFVAPFPNGRLATHVLYHLGQGLLAGWAIGL